MHRDISPERALSETVSFHVILTFHLDPSVSWQTIAFRQESAGKDTISHRDTELLSEPPPSVGGDPAAAERIENKAEDDAERVAQAAHSKTQAAAPAAALAVDEAEHAEALEAGAKGHPAAAAARPRQAPAALPWHERRVLAAGAASFHHHGRELLPWCDPSDDAAIAKAMRQEVAHQNGLDDEGPVHAGQLAPNIRTRRARIFTLRHRAVDRFIDRDRATAPASSSSFYSSCSTQQPPSPWHCSTAH